MSEVDAGPQAPPVTSRWRSTAGSVAALLRRAPMTCACIVVLWTVGVATASIADGPGPALLRRVGIGVPAIEQHHWWAPVTSALWGRHAPGYVLSTVLLVALMAPAERRWGAGRTALIFVLGQAGGGLLGTAIVRAMSRVDAEVWPAVLADTVTVTPLIGVFGLAAALSADLDTLWRRRLRLLVFTTLLVFTLYAGHLPFLLELCGALVGLLLGAALSTGRARRRRFSPSHAERRVLVAIVVAAGGLGALLVALTRGAVGPLSEFTDFLATDRPGESFVNSLCADSTLAEACRRVRAEQVATSGWQLLIALVPALLLLVAAEGLRRGRRLAWWLALAVNAAIVALAVVIMLDVLNDGDPTTGPDSIGQSTAGYLLDSLLSLALPVLTIVVLLRARRHFDHPTARAVLRPALLTMLGALAVLSVLYLALGLVLRDQFTPAATLGALLRDLPARFLPPVYGQLLGVPPVPEGAAARVLFASIGPLFWLVVLGGLLLLWWRRPPTGHAEAAREARRLLVAGGGSTLSYMSTWPGNDFWFNDDRTVAVPYRVLATVALTTGDPFGAVERRPGAVREFADFCSGNGWTPCFYSVTEPVRAAAEQLGWRWAQIAEDTVVPLTGLAFTGRKWQDVRTALHKAGREGITAQWWRFPQAPLAITDQIRAISEEWVADKGLPELGFTLGGIDELDDPEVRCLVAVDAEHTVHGVTSWLPVYGGDGVVEGWTLDFMRRRAGGFRGVMEFLIASAALGLRAEGAKYLSLSGAPLARLDRGQAPDSLQRLLDVTGRAMEPIYGFQSLLAFKAKFQPTYEPMYLVYPDAVALPAIGNAVGRAYLPHLTAAQGVRLLHRVIAP
jgi:phosphatidylglycerol lysyltransferase